MRNRNLTIAAVLLVALTLLWGCRSAMVQNVQDAPIATTGGEPPTMEEVRNAIIRAGNGLGWQMRPTEPGHIVGTLNIRSHMAQVDVLYDRENYDILYKDSRNLDYDGENIHSNYNGWIQNLTRAIDNNLLL